MRVPATLWVVALAGLAGCASVRPQAAADDLRATLDGRLSSDVTWVTGADEDAAARAAVQRLLADTVSADAAVQVALLANRRLQATYEDLGLAQAQLVQAGLLSNPVFSGRALWPLDGGHAPEIGLGVAQSFLDVLTMPLRRRVAAAAYEAARARVAGAVLDHAARTRAAFLRAQADALRLDVQRRLTAAAEAGYTASRLLREAGNVPTLDLLAEQALYETARLDLVVAEAQAADSREALVRAMGLDGAAAASVAVGGRLPPVAQVADEPFVSADGAVLDVPALERAAVAASLNLTAARADLEAAARRAGVVRTEALVPSVTVGGEAERRDGAWEAGPEASLSLPLFDVGQARTAMARSEIRRRQALVQAIAVDVRSAARVLAARLVASRRAALHYQTVLLPLRASLVRETLLQYNAMQLGVFTLLQAQQMEADATRRYVDALATYWTTRTDLDLLLAGFVPDLDGAGGTPAPMEPTSPAAH